jgi:DNA-binding NarL/FixJ family response regulator
MDIIICFIDDSAFEHMLVRDAIAPCAPDIHFVQAYTFKEAEDLLGENIPVLFLLDLWGQDMDVKDPYLTPKHELKRKISEFNSVDSLYRNLEDFHEDRINEFLKRLFGIVDSWRNLFEDVCARIGQNRKYGLDNLLQVRAHYPGIPAVFYTRKSLINDAIALFQAGADGLFKKPTGRNDAETHSLTRNYAPTLIRELSSIIDSKIAHLNELEAFYKVNRGKPVVELISSWKEFTNK